MSLPMYVVTFRAFFGARELVFDRVLCEQSIPIDEQL